MSTRWTLQAIESNAVASQAAMQAARAERQIREALEVIRILAEACEEEMQKRQIR